MTLLRLRWTGEALVPVGGHKELCDKQLTVGYDYAAELQFDRAMKAHRMQFAWLKEAWLNLPEELQADYPTPEHLRKRALIQAGFYTEQVIDLSDMTLERAFERNVRLDEFSVIFKRGDFLVIRTPESQSVRNMGNRRFLESMTAIMEVIADLIGVDPDSLRREGGRHA